MNNKAFNISILIVYMVSLYFAVRIVIMDIKGHSYYQAALWFTVGLFVAFWTAAIGYRFVSMAKSQGQAKGVDPQISNKP